MSSATHQLVLLPGSTATFFCKDGLSPIDVQEIEHFFYFGGNIQFVNCGTANEYIGFVMAYQNMKDLYNANIKSTNRKLKRDLKKAKLFNFENEMKFRSTDLYKSWAATDNGNLLFQAIAKFYCGRPILNPVYLVFPSEEDFKKQWCPDQVGKKSVYEINLI